MIKVIVFDHDGVIVRLSELVKMGAWGFVANHPDIGNRTVIAEGEDHCVRIKGNRFDVLEYAFKKLGKPEQEIPRLVKIHAKRFNDIIQEGIRTLGVTDEDRETIRNLSLQCPLYINSGTTEKEMNETITVMGLGPYFKGVFGQPTKKVPNLERAMRAECVTPEEMLFIGDGKGDYDASRVFGCHFLGLANSWNEWASEETPFPKIFSLSEIQIHLN